MPSLQPGGGGSRLRSLVRAPVVWLGVGLSRHTLYNILAVRGAVALLLSLLNTLKHSGARACTASIELRSPLSFLVSIPCPHSDRPRLWLPHRAHAHMRAHTHSHTMRLGPMHERRVTRFHTK